MATTPEQEKIVNALMDMVDLMSRSKLNLKKCPKSRLTKGYIQTKIQCIEEYWRTFAGSHYELTAITPRDKRKLLPYFENDVYSETEDLYLNLLGDLRDMVLKFDEPKPSTSAMSANFSEEKGRHMEVKLPRITIPLFTGVYDEWPTFKDLYVSLVHDNKAISNVQKLHYLKTSISGEAAALLKNVTVTESNYVLAWETLKARYGNKRLIVNSLLKRLFSQRKCITQSATQIKLILDTTSEILSSLENMDVSTNTWNPLIIFLVVQKLDPESHKDWEEYIYKEMKGTDTQKMTEELPSWADLKTFLEGKFRTLELLTPTVVSSTREKTRERTLHVSNPIQNTCVMCKENHTISHCKAFAKLQPTEKSEYVKNNKLCYNCLASGHAVFKCRVPMSCRVCHKRHHSLGVSNQADGEEKLHVNTMIASYYNAKQSMGLLATAMVTVKSKHGHTMMLKALIDPGSQACFLSEKAAQTLKLHRQHTNKIVTGMEAIEVSVKQEVQIEVFSHCKLDFNLSLQAYVMSKRLTLQIPTETWSTTWSHLNDLELADPEYFLSGQVDLLLDVKGYAKILQEGLIKGPPGSPIAQRTNLGWIVFGEINVKTNRKEKCFVTMNEEVDVKDLLQTMWEIDTNTKRKHTKEEQLCEEIYEKTYTRTKEGRYIVKLPFNTEEPKLPEGNTREIALNRFLQLEKRLNRDANLKQEYTRVIQDYKNLKHIEEVPLPEINKKAVYLPHHPVIRNDKETTKTRVVFDASCKGYNGISLNDELLTGPVLQDDLRSLIIRWRMHPVCFVSDIQKMYRMIMIAKEDAEYLRILWRDDSSHNIQHFRLLTVTFGTASAPYLAVKTLMQLAHDEGSNYPNAARILREDLYVDDVMSGGDSVEEVIKISKELKALLHAGGFELKKWSSNNA